MSLDEVHDSDNRLTLRLDIKSKATQAMLQSRLLEDVDADLIAHELFYEEFVPGEVLVAQGDLTRSFYAIVSGTCSVHIKSSKGIESQVSRLGPGDTFGELAFFYDRPRAATVKAESRVVAFRLDDKALDRIVQQDERFKRKIARRGVIRSLLDAQYLFSHIDDAYRIEKLADSFVEEVVDPGEVIIRQGDRVDDASKLYFLIGGSCDVFVSKQHRPFVQVGQLYPGDSFGELALLYDSPRAATIQCSGDEKCILLSLDRKSFEEFALKGRQAVHSTFSKHASLDYGGVKYMTIQDFLDLLKLDEIDSHKLDKKKFQIVFNIADKTGSGVLSFAEFALLISMLQTELHPELRIAFHFVDKDHDGIISGKELERAIRTIIGSEDSKILKDLSKDNFLQRDAITFEEFSTYMCPGTQKQTCHLPESISRYVSYWNEIEVVSRRSFASALLISDDHPPDMSDLHSEVSNSVVNSPFKYLLAGGIAGAVSRTAVAPLIRLKMLMQVGLNPSISGTWQGIRYMYASDGIKGLFRGNGVNILRIAPTTACQFYFFEFYKAVWKDRWKREMNVGEKMILGGFAGITAATITYPLDVVKTRLTVQSSSHTAYKGIIDCLSQLVKNEGFSSLYRGWWPTVVGVFPYIGIDFAVYETLKQVFMKRHERPTLSPLDSLFCGGVAGAVSQTVAFPLEVIRRRLQVKGFIHDEYGYNGGIWDAMKKTYNRDGIKGLYRGIVPNYLKAVPSIGIGFVVYEHCKAKLNLS